MYVSIPVACGLRSRSIGGTAVWNPAAGQIFFCLFVIFGVGSGLCDGLITRSEESYRACYVWLCVIWGCLGPSCFGAQQKGKTNPHYFWQILIGIQYGQWFTSMSKTTESLCHIQRATQYTIITEFVQCLKIPSASFTKNQWLNLIFCDQWKI